MSCLKAALAVSLLVIASPITAQIQPAMDAFDTKRERMPPGFEGCSPADLLVRFDDAHRHADETARQGTSKAIAPRQDFPRGLEKPEQYFACVVPNSETREIYDPTTQVLTLRIELTPDTAYPGSGPVYKLPLRRSPQRAPGTAHISEIALALANATFAPMLTQTSGGIPRRGAEGTVVLGNERAAAVLGSLRALVIFVPTPPYKSFGRTVSRGGPSESANAVIETTFVHGELTDLWWFATVSGEVVYRRVVSPRGEIIIDSAEWNDANPAARRSLALDRTVTAWATRSVPRILIKTSDGRTVGHSYRSGLVVVYGEDLALEAREASRFADLLQRVGVVSLVPGPHYELVLDPSFWERLSPGERQQIARDYSTAVWARAAPSGGVLLRTSEGRAVAFSARRDSVTLNP